MIKRYAFKFIGSIIFIIIFFLLLTNLDLYFTQQEIAIFYPLIFLFFVILFFVIP